MASEYRTETGILERHFDWFFVRTKAGHRWRIQADQRRFEHLLGMPVQVNGPYRDGAIELEGITPA
jgi:hypothetical protein